MKNPDRNRISQLQELPNIGKAMSEDLKILGIKHPQQLIGKNPYELYDSLCSITKQNHDLCVIDVFISVVEFMDGGKARPWWEFTTQRKNYLKKVKPNQ
jgi:Pathogenicity locus